MQMDGRRDSFIMVHNLCRALITVRCGPKALRFFLKEAVKCASLNSVNPFDTLTVFTESKKSAIVLPNTEAKSQGHQRFTVQRPLQSCTVLP